MPILRWISSAKQQKVLVELFFNGFIIKGAFIGDPQVLECAKEEMEFFYVETNNAERAQGNKNGLT